MDQMRTRTATSLRLMSNSNWRTRLQVFRDAHVEMWWQTKGQDGNCHSSHGRGRQGRARGATQRNSGNGRVALHGSAQKISFWANPRSLVDDS